MTQAPTLDAGQVHSFLRSLFEKDVHAKRILSLANATVGVLSSGSLAVHAIGQGLAQARGVVPKHAIKQVDRLLSNRGIEVWSYFDVWVPQVLAARKEIMVALDWTDFDADGHTTIALHLVTRHGRATPLLWKTVSQAELKDRRNEYEDELLLRFKEVLPAGVEKVTVLADRGFGDRKLLDFLSEVLNFDHVIRIRGNITVTAATGERRHRRAPPGRRVGRSGRTGQDAAPGRDYGRAVSGRHGGVCS